MKKQILVSAAILTAAAIGSAPLTSYAAEEGRTQASSGRCYKVYTGKGIASLSQTLKELGITFGNSGDLCPDVDKPETDAPEISKPEMTPPEAEKPEATPPTADKPETGKPETTPPSDAPETEKPEATPPTADKPETETPDADAVTAAEQVVALVNAERAKVGLSALTIDADVTAAANVRAKEIKQSFSHTRPDGSSFSSALKEQGVSFRGSGENIAWGQKSPEQVMNGWMNSDGHRANILNKNYKNIGVGYYQDENGVNYWVQLFTY